MTLSNLAKAGQLHPCKADARQIGTLVEAARRNLIDATRLDNSPETRFDCAYKAIMQGSLIAVMASGFRPATGVPGHHQTLIQTLPLTIGLEKTGWIPLDALRKKRNQADYLGAAVSATEAAEAIDRARMLLERVLAHVKAHHPELLAQVG